MTSPSSPIQSRVNPLVKRIRSLQRSSGRNRERAFIVEGLRAVSDMLAAGVTPHTLVLSDAFDPRRLPDVPAGVPVRAMSHSLFDDLSGTTTPQGIMAIAPFPNVPPGPADPPLTLIADSISDPGNLGTLLRSCAGAGVTRLLLTPTTVDPYNPKVVRSAMSAHFAVPVSRFEPSGAGELPAGTAVIISDARSPRSYDDIDMTGPTAIVVGSEATGISEDLQRIATASVSIPMASSTDSLNAAVAGSILLFEALRQRRRKESGTTILA
jgi:TrmH family RNA methyltransferase